MKNHNVEALYHLDEKMNFFHAFPYGLQHVLAMFVSNLTPILLVTAVCGYSPHEITFLIQNAMIIAGIGTLIQLFPVWKIGARLPIVMGISMSFVSTACIIGAKYGYPSVIGAVIVGGLVEGTLGLFTKYWIKFIEPIVSATIVLSIGISLLSVGAASFGGGQGATDFGSTSNWILGSITLVSCLLFNTLAPQKYKQLSVLFGLIVGYIAALFMGKVDFSPLNNIRIISLPRILPIKPEFHLTPIISFILLYLVSATETIGDTSAVVASGLGREATVKETSGALACDGYISSLSGVFGCLSISSFSQNVGMIAVTKIVNRYAIATGALILIVSGIFPAVGAFMATLPNAVLGGCMMMLFGSIVVSGCEMISRCGFTQRNIMIVSISLGIGIGFTQVPEIYNIFPETIRSLFSTNSISGVFVVAMLLNLILPKNKE